MQHRLGQQKAYDISEKIDQGFCHTPSGFIPTEKFSTIIKSRNGTILLALLCLTKDSGILCARSPGRNPPPNFGL